MNSKQRSNSKSPKKQYLTWEIYLSYITLLAIKIEDSGIKFDYIYGIERGGLIPSVILSHRLNIPYTTVFPDYINKANLLIVDDLIDSGKTYKGIKKRWDKDNGFFKYATIFKHKDAKVTPDFYIKDNDSWIVFPYEVD